MDHPLDEIDLDYAQLATDVEADTEIEFLEEEDSDQLELVPDDDLLELAEDTPF